MDPHEAGRRFADILAKAGLPRFTSAFHDPVVNELRLGSDDGFTLHIDLTRRDRDPIDDWEREAILGQPLGAETSEPIHVLAAGSAGDPRTEASLPGVLIHRAPPLRPDDVTTHNGIPVTSPSRTL